MSVGRYRQNEIAHTRGLNFYHGAALVAALLLVVCMTIAPLVPMALFMALAVMVLLDAGEAERKGSTT